MAIDKEFESLPVDARYAMVKAQLDLVISASSTRLALLPTASTLAAAFLAIGAFNETLIPYNCITKIILSTFLIIIPLSLFLYNRDLLRAEYRGREILKDYLGEDPAKGLEDRQNWLDKTTVLYPQFVIGIFTLSVLFVLYYIWF